MKNKLPIKLIKEYKNRNTLPNARCIHYPSCSTYGLTCYEKYNFISASLKTFTRLITCNAFNHETVDLPLTINKKRDLKKESLKVKPYLLKLAKDYPMSQLDDYLKFLYQRNFGPSHYNVDKETLKNNINNELLDVNCKYMLEDLSDEYVRYYFDSTTNIDELIDLFIKSQCLDVSLYRNNLFLYEINVLLKLIYKKKIPLNYNISRINILNYLNKGIEPLHHSTIYNNNYHPHYLLIKKSLLEK